MAAEARQPALVALGANLGEPLISLDAVMLQLRREAGLVRASSPWRTAAVGGPAGQPDYINAVALLVPPRPLARPAALLEWLLQLELEHGRVRTERWAARTMDLDLLSFGDLVLDEPGLQLPHPRLSERTFVLAPLAELWPEWRHPQGSATAAELLARQDMAGVTRLQPRW